MHHWGDEGVDWVGINNAAEYIAKTLSRFGVTVFGYKEKFGQVRVSVALSSNGLRHRAEAFVYRMTYTLAIKKWPHLR